MLPLKGGCEMNYCKSNEVKRNKERLKGGKTDEKTVMNESYRKW